MARFSSREGRWHGRWRGTQTGQPSHGEAVRDEREFVTDFGNGLVRVDIGAPIPRLSSEPRANLKASKPAPKAPEVEPQLPEGLPADLRTPSTNLPAFKPGLGRG